MKRALRVAASLVLAALLLPLIWLLPLRWMEPRSSAFMRRSAAAGADVSYDWVELRSIAPEMVLAVVASEDQRFPDHWGIDLEALADAVAERERRGELRGASTITQQTVKNLFLWPDRSLLRKGVEAYLAVLAELVWPKRHILEIYLNVVELGEGTFGVEAASRRFFGRSAAELSPRQAATLAAVLPNPSRLRADHPSAQVRRRAGWIRKQVEQLGGPAYLDPVLGEGWQDRPPGG
ncbi:MAG: monofunctional biosynthetic peptidoglycan transglycosylase [Thermoanaerobaculia bacterium]|nr:monofunctional biosynthetic peptidoglycan transglycosylase [Thermoanaerobaculia bacterium]